MKKSSKHRLIKDIKKIKDLRTREEVGSDGGGSGRSDTNDSMMM